MPRICYHRREEKIDNFLIEFMDIYWNSTKWEKNIPFVFRMFVCSFVRNSYTTQPVCQYRSLSNSNTSVCKKKKTKNEYIQGKIIWKKKKKYGYTFGSRSRFLLLLLPLPENNKESACALVFLFSPFPSRSIIILFLLAIAIKKQNRIESKKWGKFEWWYNKISVLFSLVFVLEESMYVVVRRGGGEQAKSKSKLVRLTLCCVSSFRL